MRIVHFLNHTEKANGHVAVAVDLACEQAKQHQVHMISAPGDFDRQLTAAGVNVVHVGHASSSRPPIRMIRMVSALLPHLRRIRPDIVNAHMVAAAVSAWAVKHVYGFKLVTTVHNSFDRNARMMGVGDRVIAVSDAVNAEMRGVGVHAAKLRTVTNGTIGGARRPAMPTRRIVLERPAVVSVCGMHGRKGVDHLIVAFDAARRSCPDAHLYLVGEGPERPSYEEQARATASAEHIHFLGYMDDPREVLANADIFVLASLRDPFPLVLSEARQMGNAIIATCVDGIPEALDGGRLGLLVPPGDSASLRDAIVLLLMNPDLRRQFAAAGGEALHEISVAHMSRRTIDVYVDALGTGSPSEAMQVTK